MSVPDPKRNPLSRLWRPVAEGPNILSTTFAQPLGRNFEPGRIGGYYIDLYVKSPTPQWPQPWFQSGGLAVWVATTQYGLGAHERYLDGLGDEWLEAAAAVGDQLIVEQQRGGPRDGAWLHNFDYPHTFKLSAPWPSAIAQGQAASLLVRLALLTSADRYAEAAARALQPMQIPSRDGGVGAELDGGYFLEEYPTDPPSFVLNGGIFGLWGAYDVAVGLDHAAARGLFDAGVATLESNLHRYDTGYWSRYDLYPHRAMNIASAAYHELHIDQLEATAMLSGSTALADGAERFRRYQSSRLGATRAFARKVVFRLAVPRNPLAGRPNHPRSHGEGPTGAAGSAALITEIDGIAEIEDDWRRLAQSRGNPFVSPEWFRAWMRHYGDEAEPCVIAVSDAQARLRGVLPLVSVRRGGFTALRFAGANLGDIFHPAALAEDEADVATAAVEALFVAGRRPAYLVLDRVEAEAAWWRAAASRWQPSPSRLTTLRHDVLPAIEFEGRDWDEYMATRSRNMRSQTGRRLRRLEREHEVCFRTTSKPAQVDTDMAEFFRLHDARWTELSGSESSTELSRAFHTDFAAAALDHGWLRLWFLELDGAAAASWYGWRLGDRYSFYLSGFEPRWDRLGVGSVLLAETMRAAAEEGARTYDMLLGNEAYKWRFATGHRDVETIVIARRGHPAAMIAKLEAAMWRLSRRLPAGVRAPARAAYSGIERLFPTGSLR